MVSIPTESEFLFLRKDTENPYVYKYESYAIPTESDFGFLRYKGCISLSMFGFDSSGI